ncbi:MAG: RHS repeat protein, partial [Candidatus Electrothrix sp. AR1]|nr:RHS repeat protein [Candidatus Electrothrix sp. AR1]
NFIEYEYDKNGNKTSEIARSVAGEVLREISYAYYSDSRNLLREVRVDNGYPKRFEYDVLGRKTAEVDQEGNRTEYTYDNVGNIVAVNTPAGITENFYDKGGRLVRTVNPLHQETEYAYDANGNATWTRDPQDRETSFYYDALNRKIGVTDAAGATTTFDHNIFGNRIAVIDANGGSTRYAYDANSRKTEEIRPKGAGTTEETKTVYQYDNVGNLHSVTDPENRRAEYTYNALGKPEQVTYSQGSMEKSVDYNYDLNGNLLGYNDGSTSAAYTYDGLNRKIGATVDFGPFSKDYSYAYPNALQTRFTGPDGTEISYNYDQAGRPQSVLIPGQGQISYAAYNWNRPGKVYLPNNVNIEHSYDALMRHTTIAAYRGQYTLNSIIMYRHYSYYEAGDIEKNHQT